MTKYIRHVLVLATAVVAAACTMTDGSAPPLAGPSEMSLSLVDYGKSRRSVARRLVADIDYASRRATRTGSLRQIVPLRIEILADGQPVDFGTISARTLVTNSNGRATFTYTAPRLSPARFRICSSA